MWRAVTDEDLQHLHDLVEMRDGGPPWVRMMDASAPDMRYQAWRRDPSTGPPQYCSKTVYDSVTPELVRDFFWDDEFRLKWDDMLTHAAILQDCAATGAMVVRWVRKFPFFCSDREYVIARRIWAAGDSYYCVTKGVPDAPVPRSDKPRRVDVYYSSWCIRPVTRQGEPTGTEVILFHHEDMGIPWEIAKLGVKQGMWRTVKKIQRGIRAYQRTSAEEGEHVSRSALMARVNTKVDPDSLRGFGGSDDGSGDSRMPEAVEKAPGTTSIPKLLIFGGAVIMACSLDKALLAKAVMFGIGRKFAKISRSV
uniref:START domain-containing protein n=1 Tax=Kalanchoe fedtschenkoi TaxID=63787 RepID=A0A7N0T8D2_KALFE